MKRLHQVLKFLLILSFMASLASGCGSLSLSDTYQLESVNQNGSETSRVYRAENKTVPTVARELSEQKKPKEMSKEDEERMFLVYPDEWYHLQRDPERPQDTLIEVDSKEFVRQNYSPSFLEGYIVASLLDDLFDGLKRYPDAGGYRGYASKDIYKSKSEYRPPTTAEKKAIPPITVEKSGTIVKRSDKPSSASGPVGSKESVFKKEPETPSSSTSDVGKITKSPNVKSEPKFAPPRTKSPPKTKVGGVGKITKRR